MPLFVRMPASDWMDHEPELKSWDIRQALVLAKALIQRGVDFFDVSSGGLVAAQKITAGPGYLAPLLRKDIFGREGIWCRYRRRWNDDFGIASRGAFGEEHC